MPDSARASHILIPFIGAQRVSPDVTRTVEEAKKTSRQSFYCYKKKKE